jgi:hypothetical protein
MKDAIINVLMKGILDSVSLHSHEEETPIKISVLHQF